MAISMETFIMVKKYVSQVIENIGGGTSATITGATATINNATGTPSVSVELGGTESERTFAFSFKNLKGAKGDKGDKGDTGAKGEKGDTGPAGSKGDKGDPGAKGAAFTYADFTPEQLAALKGAKGETGAKGDKGETGATISSITFTQDETGVITGGTATLSDGNTVDIVIG